MQSMRQEVLLHKLFPGRAWTLWLQGFFDVPVQGDCEARVPARMWSEEKGVYVTPFNHLPCSLQEEACRAVGVAADNWMFQPASGYSVWFMLNAWEMAKLRAYYLHGPWQDAVELWTGVWSSWLQGPHPFPETTAPSMPCCSDFRNSLDFDEARKAFDAALQFHLRMSEIRTDFDKAVDCFEQFLLCIPAFTRASDWKFNPKLALDCLQLGLPLSSAFGKHAIAELTPCATP